MMDTLKERLLYHQPVEQTYNIQTFPHEAFWSGMASGLDLFGQFRVPRYNCDPWEADFDALYGDWEAIGQDLGNAIYIFGLQNHKALGIQERLFDPDDSPENP